MGFYLKKEVKPYGNQRTWKMSEKKSVKICRFN